MTREPLVRAALMMGLASVSAASAAAQERASVALADRLVSVRSIISDVPFWAPDGRSIAFTSSQGGAPGLWSVARAGGAPRQLVDSLGGVPYQMSRQPSWSPNGDYIAYVSDKAVANSNAADIWLWSARERRHVRLTHLESRIGSTSWSPDGRHIAFSSALNGNYDIFTVSVPDGRVQQLTRDTRYEITPVWTPDARSIIYVRADARWVDHEILRIPAAGGAASTIASDRDFFDYSTSAGTPAFGVPRISPDGRTVVFRSWRSGWINYWAVPLQGGAPVRVAAEDADQSNAAWSPDGRALAFTSNHNGTHDLRVVAVRAAGGGPIFGAARVLVSPSSGIIGNVAWAPDGRAIAHTLGTPTQPADLFVADPVEGATTRLTTSVARELTDMLVVPEKIAYRSDTLTIHAYLYRPKGAAPGQRLPGIVFGHGGPTSQYGDSFELQMQYFAGLGYLVLAPNFRGSSGYGRAFADANDGCWAHCDLADLVAGVAHLRAQPYSNGRFGITGTSHGGLLAMAGATFAPGVFQAAIAHGGTADRIYYYNTQELRHLQQADDEFGPLADNVETYRYVSPFYSAREVNTPIFVIWGEGRWPGSQNSRNYVAELERFYKTHRARVYQGENYYVSGAANTREMLADMAAFFEQYLAGNVVDDAAAAPAHVP